MNAATSLRSYFPYFEKIKSRLVRSPYCLSVCLSVCLSICVSNVSVNLPLLTFECLHKYLRNLFF
jgi:hypothetical protein